MSGIADLGPLNRAKEQRAWYFYDWANSAFATTVAGVLFGPYIKEIAENAAVDNRISVIGISISPGALPPFIITASTILSAVLLPLLGAVADRTARKKDLLAGFAWAGSAAAALLFFVTGDNWQLGVVAFLVAQPLLRRLGGLQRRDPAADLDRGRARPRLQPRLGDGVRRRRPPARGQLRSGHAARHLRPDRGHGGPDQHALRRGLVGGVHVHPVPRHQEPAAGGCGGGRRRRVRPQLRPALGDAEGHAQLPRRAHLPGRLPVLQRRHPDRHLPGLDLRHRRARLQPRHRAGDVPVGAVRGGRRRHRVRPGGRQAAAPRR